MPKKQARRQMNDEKNGEEKDESITEVLDFTKPDFEFKPKEYHGWRQQGFFLICKSCEITHATFIGSEKLMVGTNNNGQPILQDRKNYEYKK